MCAAGIVFYGGCYGRLATIICFVKEGIVGEAERQILQMLEEGAITAEEAEGLLAAMEPEEKRDDYAGQVVITPDLPEAEPYEPPPDMKKFRHFWRIPFFIAGGSLLLSAFGLALMYQSTGQVVLIGFMCVWSIFIVALLATVLALLTRKAPWLHVRVQEKGGRRIAISLPLPLRLASWGINIAKIFVPADQSMNLEMASTFMKQMTNDPDQEPIMINVDDDDGDHVQLYLG
jgi:hypothetical protein